MEGITKIYPNGFMANKNVTFAVNAKEIHALIGENGAGKTTLMKILFGHENCQEGKIYIRGEEVKISNPLDAIENGVGMVHQHFMLVPNLSVADNIMLGIEPGKGQFYDAKKSMQIVKDAARKYQLEVDPATLVRDLSVGNKQKVELLKALIRGAQVLILDEPTAVLTPQETKELFKQLKVLRDQGYGIIFISHKLEEVMELCDRCTVLRRGHVTGHGEITGLDSRKLSRMMVERDVTLEIDKEEAQPSNNILQVENLNYINDNGKRVLTDLTFGVRAGEIVGIAGVEGNGQTELSEIISGLIRRTDGNVFLNGKETGKMNIQQIRSTGLAHISEDRMKYGIAPNLSIRDNIASIYLQDKKFNKGPFLNLKELNDFVDWCIQEFEIACTSSKSAMRFLSGGNIQKVVIAREFCSGANFILANQPTRGIDVGTTELIRRLLVQYTRKKNYGVLLISSDLNEIMEVSDRLLVMFEGRFVAQIPNPKSITTNELGEYMLGVKRMTSEEMGVLF